MPSSGNIEKLVRSYAQPLSIPQLLLHPHKFPEALAAPQLRCIPGMKHGGSPELPSITPRITLQPIQCAHDGDVRLDAVKRKST